MQKIKIFELRKYFCSNLFQNTSKISASCRILLLLEKIPLTEHLLARADTLPYQAKRGNFAIISSFYLIPYFPSYKITTFPLTFQIIPQLFILNHDFFILNQYSLHKKRRLPALNPFVLLTNAACCILLGKNKIYF